MKNNLPKIIALSALIIGVGGCTQDRTVIAKEPGTYESEVSTTDADGTTTEQQSSTVVKKAKSGKKTAVIKSKTTKDPRGLLNKTTTEETERVVIEDK